MFQNRSMKSSFLLAGALLLGMASGGCGGATSAVVTARTDGAVFALSPGQNAVLSIQTQGGLVGGTLSVPTSSAPTTPTNGALTIALPRGNYGFNGTLAPDSTFRAGGNVPTVAPFVLAGQLGVGASPGSFSFFITVNGQTQRVSGQITRR